MNLYLAKLNNGKYLSVNDNGCDIQVEKGQAMIFTNKDNCSKKLRLYAHIGGIYGEVEKLK